MTPNFIWPVKDIRLLGIALTIFAACSRLMAALNESNHTSSFFQH